MADSNLCCCYISKRFTVGILACIGFMISSGIRSNLTVNIAKTRASSAEKQDIILTISTIEGMDSFYLLGSLVSQIPGGFLSAKYPANLIFGTAIAISSVLNLFVPETVRSGYDALMLLRFAQGLADGVKYPASYGILRWWAPPMERTRLATMAFCGSDGGTLLGIPLSGYILGRFGGSAPFYVYGVLGIVWYFIWLWLVSEKPSNHPTITRQELLYIEKSIGPMSSVPPNFKSTPWRAIFSSMPVWAIVVANFCRAWTFCMILIILPIYCRVLSNLHWTLGNMPYLLMTIIVPLGGILADYLRHSNILTTTQTRKIFNCGGFGLEGVFLLLVLVGRGNTLMLVIFLSLAVGFSQLAISGFYVNILDIAPRYAGSLMGITNVAGIMSELLFAIFFNATIQDGTNDEWRTVFLMAVIIHFSGILFYSVFASGEMQSWAEPPSDNDEITAQNVSRDRVETTEL